MKRGLITAGFITFLLSSIVFPLFNIRPAQVAAATYPFSFENQATISGNVDLLGIGKLTFFDKNIYDNTYNYAPQNPPHNVCDPGGGDYGITLSGTPNFQHPSLKATINIGSPVGVNCVRLSFPNPEYINNPLDKDTGMPAGRTNLVWDGSWISKIPGEEQTNENTWQALTNAPGLYSAQTSHNGNCGSYGAILLDSGSTHLGTAYQFVTSDQTGAIEPATAVPQLAPAYTAGSGCLIAAIDRVVIGGTQGTNPPGGGGGGGAGGAGNQSLGCDTQYNNPLTWIICPVVDILVGVVDFVDNMITDQLNVKTNAIFCDTGTCNAYYKAWQSFRDIALGLMAIAGLVIVIAQALGLEILDAYVIRKTLPRLLIAAIGIALSWPLMRFLIQISDDLGFGVRHLIYQPFASLPDKPDLSFGGGAANFFFGGLSAGVAPIAGLVIVQLAGGLGALLAYVGTAALAVFVAIVVLILRQVAIILLMLVSPIAIVAYILPNTQRIYKLWWESFSKALLMFPLIAAFIATGRVFSAITFNNGGGLNQVIGFASYFAPYFMIPLTFRMAGSTMGALGNFVNSRAQGGFNKLNELRGGLRKKKRAEMAAGDALKGRHIRFMGYGKFASRYSQAVRGVANAPKAGYNPSRWRERYRAAEATRTMGAASEALEKNPFLGSFKTDDDIVEAGLLHANEDDRYRELRRRGLTHERATQGVAAIRAFERSVDASTFDRAMLMASAGTSSGWTPKYNDRGELLNPETAGGAGQLRQMINDKLGNDRQSAIAVLGAVRQQAESKGRFDLVGGSFTEDAQMLEDQSPTSTSGTKLSVEEWTKQVHRNALDGQSRAKLINGHNRSLQALAPEMGEALEESIQGRLPAGEADPTWTDSKGVEQYAFMASALDYASGGAPEMARHIKNQLNKTVDLAGMDPRMLERIRKVGVKTLGSDGRLRSDLTHGEVMEALRKDQEFGEYRREYGRAYMDEDTRRRVGPPGT